MADVLRSIMWSQMRLWLAFVRFVWTSPYRKLLFYILVPSSVFCFIVVLFAWLGSDFTANIMQALIPVILWLQVELAIRQHYISMKQADPYFKVEISKSMQSKVSILMHNISRHPAYNVQTEKMFDKSWREKHVSLEVQGVALIKPDESQQLCTMDGELLQDLAFLEVSYVNVFGQIRHFYIAIMDDDKAYILPTEPMEPGIFLNLPISLKILYDRWLLFRKRRIYKHRLQQQLRE